MRVGFLLSTAIACTAVIGGYTVDLSQAVQLRDGKVYFVQPPSLGDVVTTYKETYVWGATYYFTIGLPENAGEPLQRITINQREGVDRVRFDLKDTSAFEGTRSKKGQKLALKDAASDRKTKTISLTFDPPVPPGRTITIALKPVQNPQVAGVYLFGVTAFPPGEQAHGQFLGYGRLQFYNFGPRFF
ncbi:hypothetical protein SAMD00079811_69210 [Scytonema sp. HK-05]|uniref:DUF2808 domain-containing protein n=1 Tax=Scytonema sp. HK-05 TaxID=1137095 RepID=UPI0009375F28|nr:DUF2808 domain-containing protein [Scytonema sp. HK-05]OKH58448.1 hypothetical protein NIES2130_14275 [Scytonema sp. HK-05]BAY49292.1 hypothetical protein SAMD00079811_69210 [Scytonema sp. HK-05]